MIKIFIYFELQLFLKIELLLIREQDIFIIG